MAALLITPFVGSPTPLQAQAADGNPDGISGKASVTDVLLSEDFENKTTDLVRCINPQNLPGWTGTYVKGYCWAFFTPNAWNNTGGSGAYLTVGSGQLATENDVVTPAMDFSNATAATLSMNMYRGANCTATSGTNCSQATIAVKAANEQNWTVIKTYEKETIPGGSYSIPLTEHVAGKSGVQIRFAWNAPGPDGNWSLDNVKVEATAPPPAPTNLTAQAEGAETIKLAWQPAAGAGGYKLQDSPNGTGQWADLTTIGSAAQTSFDVTGLKCNTARHFRVRALSTSGESAPSNVANATTSACAAATQIDESFSTNGLPTGWTVISGTPNRGAWVFNNPNAGRTDWPGRKDAAGNTSGFAIADFLYAPGENTGSFWNTELRTPVFSLAGAANASVRFDTVWVDWVPKMTVDLSVDAGQTWKTVYTIPGSYGNGSPVIDISSAAGESQVMVRFNTQFGVAGSWWLIDNVKISATAKPGAPTNLAAVPTLNSDVLLSWDVDDKTSTVKLERSTNNGGSWSQIASLGSNVKSYKDENVSANTDYAYRAIAENGAGKSVPSAVATIKTPAAASSNVVDVNIGLYYDPPADRKAQFENIALFFADAVYEASNGGTKVRRVTFFPNNLSPTMDVLWRVGNSPATSGLYRNRAIYYWDGTSGGDQGTLFSQEQRGNTLAHEFGHYHFSLPDEDGGSTMTPYSLMSWQHNRAVYAPPAGQERDYRWLNFSTDKNYESATVDLGGGFVVTVSPKRQYRTRDGKYIQVSAWEALAKQPSASAYRLELVAGAPDLNTFPALDLAAPNGKANARSEFEVCWTTSCKRLTAPNGSAQAAAADAVFESIGDTRAIVIERSAATVTSDQLEDMKSAAKRLVDALPTGSTVAVLAFDGAVSVIQTATALDSQAARDGVKAAIDTISLGDDAAALGDALNAARTQILAVGDEAGPATAVYLMGSGRNTTGSLPNAGVLDYQEAQLSLYAIDIGATDDGTALLQLLADETGGAYFAAASGLGSLFAAVDAGERTLTREYRVDIAAGSAVVSPEQALAAPFFVDDSLGTITVKATFVGEETGTALAAVAPDNTETALTCERSTTTPTSTCEATIAAPATGPWTVKGTATDSVSVDYAVSGLPAADGSTFHASLMSNAGYLVTYPDIIRLTATLARDDLATNLAVNGRLIDPYGTEQTLQFRDDGVSPDETAEDGLYAATYAAEINGDYHVRVTFDNESAAGILTQKGLVLEPTEVAEGEFEPVEPTTTPITKNLDRYADLVLTVTGAPIIGPNGERSGDSGPVVLTPDGTPVGGRVTAADPTSTYQVTIPDDFTGTFYLRVIDLQDGMVPAVKATTSDESWSRQGTLREGESTLAWQIPAEPGSTIIIEVGHADVTATTGAYSVSAGPELPTDSDGTAPDGVYDDLVPGAGSQKSFLPLIVR
ncbi:MAG: fibronectin type III domain-containing protein [Caldilineaceae bacterium]